MRGYPDVRPPERLVDIIRAKALYMTDGEERNQMYKMTTHPLIQVARSVIVHAANNNDGWGQALRALDTAEYEIRGVTPCPDDDE